MNRTLNLMYLVCMMVVIFTSYRIENRLIKDPLPKTKNKPRNTRKLNSGAAILEEKKNVSGKS